jgi:hypothetical protein
MIEQLEIEREKNRVILTLNLKDEYAAMATYDKLVAQALDGFVLLDVEIDDAKD